MRAIVAVSKNWGIGLNNDLLFNIPADKKFFRETTTGGTVIMGRKTLLSMPASQPLKNRVNIVFSRDESFSAEGVTMCRSLHELPSVIGSYDNDNVFVIGGEEIYKLLLPMCSEVLVTKIDCERTADKFFPDLDASYEWKLTYESEEAEYDGLKYKFCTYTYISHL